MLTHPHTLEPPSKYEDLRHLRVIGALRGAIFRALRRVGMFTGLLRQGLMMKGSPETLPGRRSARARPGASFVGATPKGKPREGGSKESEPESSPERALERAFRLGM